MDMFCDPFDITSRYGPLLAELRRLFVFHGLSCGAPEDLLCLVSQMEENKALRVDVSAFFQSIGSQSQGRFTEIEALTALCLACGGEDLVEGRVSVAGLSRSIGLLRMFIAGISASNDANTLAWAGSSGALQQTPEATVTSEPDRLKSAPVSPLRPEPASIGQSLSAGQVDFTPETFQGSQFESKLTSADDSEDTFQAESLASELVVVTPNVESGADHDVEQAFLWDRTERVFLPLSSSQMEHLSTGAAVPSGHTRTGAKGPASTGERKEDEDASEPVMRPILEPDMGGSRTRWERLRGLELPTFLLLCLGTLGVIAAGGFVSFKLLHPSHKGQAEVRADKVRASSPPSRPAGSDAPVHLPSATATFGLSARDDHNFSKDSARNAESARITLEAPPPVLLGSAHAKRDARLSEEGAPTLSNGITKPTSEPESVPTGKTATQTSDRSDTNRGYVVVPQAEMQGHLISSRQAVYPEDAIRQHLQGSVLLKTFIAKDGSVKRIDVVRGQSVFIHSAVAAASWRRYRPYLRSGNPVEVETEVTVNFTRP